ncbi:ubiquinol-cytochrome c reductase iron-sulfur subunit [Anabaenopsis tanganyikae CS-531]|jgi:cytochrome b6-f complex iron-sulfur subunit|uniref:Ubiquinol-cytochrome c reductase iron-sulfur subunit n=2 Tax=Anabaenopsis TaxID=110103 RepID=A0ABT5AWN4_9CYAN|nr:MULTISPECIES: ubiquinol-cytochrome c reductase iron-sulfur subunit [Anabaenopsis]MDB9540755.1 ubiquinol-cytochrome c reductase iron-sulfur subunit [Anabaenopsis arnoldii]MDH6093194.1 ubiquinol-cytochrome c reductase iron-sulfur subunit [Anabaenopsis arnoldii]MDH6100792.1 ubiquinol-cytochrome c reductase iron-sulfur subunit [Anabaenopsis sp. FSS-46]MDH6107116.1 ubiquinol-cytochrome c reductase iron-sulfur subunit [Anabaenopsis tanganyikae CS-531]
MKRRDFINWVGLSTIASSLPVAIAACASKKVSRDWQTVGTVTDLDKDGQLLVQKSPTFNVLVVGTSVSENLIAVDPTCTHSGCTVTWDGKGNKFACRCHGAEYNTNGQVRRGPAREPLKTYSAKIENNSVLVKQN